MRWNNAAFTILLLSAASLAVMAPACADTSIPFTIEEISGSRPVVTITVNGHPYKAFVHANAGLYLQINHAQASDASVTGITHKDSFGIEKVGKVSALGRDMATAANLDVGGVVDHDVSVSVFEKPVDVCMLGLGWITAHGVIIDYPASQVIVPSAAESHSALRNRLLSAGYSAHAMRLDQSDGRYLVTATIGDQVAEFLVSSVVDVTIDSGFAARAGLKQGKVLEDYGGPSGATGYVYESTTPVSLGIDQWRSKPRRVPIEDTYAYMKQERPSVPRGGYIGADFLIAHAAVIDFGAKTLYLK